MFTGENAVQSKLLYRGYQLEVRRAPSGWRIRFPFEGCMLRRVGNIGIWRPRASFDPPNNQAWTLNALLRVWSNPRRVSPH